MKVIYLVLLFSFMVKPVMAEVTSEAETSTAEAQSVPSSRARTFRDEITGANFTLLPNSRSETCPGGKVAISGANLHLYTRTENGRFFGQSVNMIMSNDSSTANTYELSAGLGSSNCATTSTNQVAESASHLKVVNKISSQCTRVDGNRDTKTEVAEKTLTVRKLASTIHMTLAVTSTGHAHTCEYSTSATAR